MRRQVFSAAATSLLLAASATSQEQDAMMRWGEGTVEKLAGYLGPATLQNPHVQLGRSELKVKSIVVAGWIESRTETLQADEATVKNVLAAIDYSRLSELIEQ